MEIYNRVTDKIGLLSAFICQYDFTDVVHSYACLKITYSVLYCTGIMINLAIIFPYEKDAIFSNEMFHYKQCCRGVAKKYHITMTFIAISAVSV